MNILIVGPSWVGDMVMAQTLFVCLKQRHPDCQIDVLAPVEPADSRTHARSAPGAELSGRARRARHGDPAQGCAEPARSVPAGDPAAQLLKSALVPFFAGIPKRTGWRGEMRFGLLNDMRKLDKQRYPLMIERFMALAFEPGAELPKPYPNPSLRIDTATRDAALARFGLSLDRPVLALCPGAEFGESSAGRRNTSPRWPS